MNERLSGALGVEARTWEEAVLKGTVFSGFRAMSIPNIRRDELGNVDLSYCLGMSDSVLWALDY